MELLMLGAAENILVLLLLLLEAWCGSLEGEPAIL